MGIKIYTPKKRIDIEKETMPVVMRAGTKASFFGNIFEFLISGIFVSFKTLFKTKNKIRELQSRREKVFDLR